MKRLLSTCCCLVFCSMPALATGKAADGSPMSDQKFVEFVAQTDMVEANLGQLAQSAASSQQVKDYAQMLVTDHTGDYNQLYNLAHGANLTIPEAIDDESNRKMIAPFQKLNGEAFDHHYIHEMIVGHTEAIAIFKKEAADATNPALKSYAEQVLPVLQKHLEEAKALEKAK